MGTATTTTITSRRQLVLAASLVAIELVAGMQAYLTQTIVPIMAADLAAQDYYGVITGTGQIANLIALPVGAHLVRRHRLPPLLMAFTIGLCLGAVACAVAPTIEVYLVGQALRAFAGGCLAAISITAVAVGLEQRARQLTLALMQGTWIVSSILGPAYAATVTHFLSWRWAMVLYLPVLVICRWVVATHLHGHQPSHAGALPIPAALLLGAGLALTILPVAGPSQTAVVLAGAVVMALAATRVLPPGTFALRSPRHRALALMFGLTGAYFAASAVIALTAHDRFGLDVAQVGVIITSGGLAWAVVGLLCGLRPALAAAVFRRRAIVGIAVIALSFAGTAAYLTHDAGLPALPVLATTWGLAGVGIGLVYLDTLNRLFSEPDHPDGLDAETVAGASVMAESIAAAITTTLATTWIGTGFGIAPDIGARHTISWFALLVAALICLVPMARAESWRAQSTAPGTTAE